MKEYDIFVPLYLPNGGRVSEEKIAALKKRLVECFGGLTHFSQTNEGLWKIGRSVFRDEITILRVLAADEAKAESFIRDLKVEMESDFQQEEVLIVAREVTLV
jgi:hypothetical protein